MKVEVLSGTKQIFNGIPYWIAGIYFMNSSQKTKKLHRAVWIYFKGEIPFGYDIHHKDNNPHNNQIENLRCLLHEKHIKIHANTEDAKNRARKSLNKYARPEAIKWHKSKEGSEWHTKHIKDIWRNSKKAIRKCDVCQSEYSTHFISRSKYCGLNCRQTALRRRRGITAIHSTEQMVK